MSLLAYDLSIYICNFDLYLNNERIYLKMSQPQRPVDCILFLSTMLSKMSQLFSDLNFTYLNTMMHKRNIEETYKFQQQSKLNTEKKQGETKDKDIKIEDKENNEKGQTKNNDKMIKIESEKPEKDDINPPPPPPSSYILFFKDHREKISKEYPDSSITQLSKIASQCWRELSEEEKKPYNDKFVIEKKKYYQALKVYNKLQSNVQGKPKKQKIKKVGGKNKKGKGAQQVKKVTTEQQKEEKSFKPQKQSQSGSDIMI